MPRRHLHCAPERKAGPQLMLIRVLFLCIVLGMLWQGIMGERLKGPANFPASTRGRQCWHLRGLTSKSRPGKAPAMEWGWQAVVPQVEATYKMIRKQCRWVSITETPEKTHLSYLSLPAYSSGEKLLWTNGPHHAYIEDLSAVSAPLAWHKQAVRTSQRMF